MLDPITITIPGELRGKGRPRFSTRGGFARAYTDAKTASAETWVKACAVEQAGQPVLEGPLSLTLTIGVTIPRSWSKRRQADAASGALRPTGKPDADNVLKLLSDALNKIIWRDDSQLTDILLAKVYSAAPSTVLIVRQVQP